MRKQIYLVVIIINSFFSLVFGQVSETKNNNYLEKKVSLSVNNIQLDNVLDLLSKQAGCYFTYNADQINGSKLTTIYINNYPLKLALDTILKPVNYNYQLINNQVVIHTFPIVPVVKPLDSIEFYSIKGSVFDGTTNKELPFASLVIKNSYFGGITNESGSFNLNIPKHFFNDTLIFSYMGYFNKEIPISDIKNDLTVKLEPGIVSLQEIIIRNIEPLKILKKSRELFNTNYYNKSYNFEAFYRESVKKNSRFMIYSEALINGFKPSFLIGGNNKVELEKARKFNNIQHDDTLLVKLRGGMSACFQLDLIHQLPDFLQENSELYYNYLLNDIIVWQDELVYVLEFKQKEYIHETLFEGIIYISVNSWAIVGAKFSFTKSKLRKTSNLFVIKKSRQLKIKPIKTEYQIYYDKWNGKYYTKHVRGELVFKVKKRRHLFHENYSTMMEMVYTQIDTTDVKKPMRKDLFKTNTVFSDSEYVYDPDFWKLNNTIKPENNIIDAFKKSGFKLQQQD